MLKYHLIEAFAIARLVWPMILILAYCGIILAGYYFVSDKLIFPPRRATYTDTEQILKLKTEDGAQISAIYVPNPGATYTILFSHGNGEDLGTVLQTLKKFKRMGFAAFAYDYHGYGTSTGIPSERNTYRDVDAAYSYVTNDLRISPGRVVAYGRSLGGAVAIDLASRKPVAGLVVESSFVTAFRVMTHYPLSPLDKFRSISKIKQAHCPVLVIHGRSDELVPFWHGERLFSEANGPKQSLWVDGAGHNNLLNVAGEQYDEGLRRFIILLDKTPVATNGRAESLRAV